MDVQAWLASTHTHPSPTHPLTDEDSIVIDNTNGRLIHSDAAIERVLHAATDANYQRLLNDGYKGSGRSSSSSPPSSPSRQPSPRLLFTSRRERGSQSNPLEDARHVLADYRARRLDTVAGAVEDEDTVAAASSSATAAPAATGEGDDSCSNVDHDDDNDDDDEDNDLASYVPWNQPSVLPAYILHHNHQCNHSHSHSRSHSRDAPRIIIYQTRGVYTGGTVALALLAERLDVLGYSYHLSPLLTNLPPPVYFNTP